MKHLIDKFEKQVQNTPNKKAILFCDGTSISFKELDLLSNKIANYLKAENLKPRDVVAIRNNKTKYGFATMIACLKSGVIYTNYDFSNPQERIDKMFRTAQPKLVVVDTELDKKINAFSEKFDAPAFEAETPAYIMFTSGSTGIPKGVLIKQSAISNFAEWAYGAYELSPDDIMTNVNPIYFDNSVFDFYCSVFNGITMAAFPKEIVEQPKKTVELIDELGCTFWFSVPSFIIYLMNIKLLNGNTFKKLRAFSFGGEGFPKPLLKKLHGIYPEKDLYNVYGPTEGTCICSAYKVRESDLEDMEGLVTLGNIAPIFDYKIVDGELWLGGPQIAVAYYNDPVRTEKSFTRDGFYKTGDLVEEIDGKLYFKGRADNQIKHMGYRIELEEIEAGLIKLPYVKQCAVVHGKTATGFPRLVAYLHLSENKEQSEVRDDLKKYLPSYMIPTNFEFPEKLPKNANGKVDRVKLKELAGLH
ncbi:MAG: AMP-binding protein [Alphaproteobacteria bacterium]|nr:AMP-binding protein [Alphaproteobacteria bacterium]